MKEIKQKQISIKYVVPNKKELKELDKILADVKKEDKSVSLKKLKKVKNKKKILKRAS